MTAFEVVDRASTRTLHEPSGTPIGLIVVPVLLSIAAAGMRDRFEPRAILVPHHALTFQRAIVPPNVADSRVVARAGRETRSAHMRPAVRPREPAPAAAMPAVAQSRSESAIADEALTALQEEQFDDALLAARDCMLHDRGASLCLGVAAESAILGGHADEARGYVTRCRETTSDETHCILASTLLAVHDGDLTMAAIATWRLTQIAPASGDAYVAHAQLAELRSDPEAAEISYRTACEQGDSSFACDRLGELLATTR